MPISLPKELNLEVEKKVKQGHYASKSEYIREVVREDLALKKKFDRQERRIIAKGLKAVREGRVSKVFDNPKEMIKYLRSL